MDTHPTTIAGLASAPGAGARAIVRLSGPRSFALAGARFQPSGDAPTDALAPRAAYAADGWFRPEQGPPIPCARWSFPGPRSYTGEDVCELHLSGGALAARRVFAALLADGAAPAGPGDFTRRAFEAGRLDLAQVEAVLALLEAEDPTRARAALAGLDGRLADALAGVEAPLLEAASLLAASLDFADRDLGSELEGRALQAVDAALHASDAVAAGEHARPHGRVALGGARPRAVLIGAPNAGKSSLFNALLGEARAATDSRAGTTRDPVAVAVTLGGAELELIDPAGLGEPTGPLDSAAMDRARAMAAGADLAIAVAPPGHPWPAADVLDRAAAVIFVRSQVDTGECAAEASVVRTSAVEGTGLPELAARIGAAIARRAQPSGVLAQARAGAALRAVRAALVRAGELLRAPVPATELALFEVGEARVELGRVAARIDTEDVLDAIFARFCIGK